MKAIRNTFNINHLSNHLKLLDFLIFFAFSTHYSQGQFLLGTLYLKICLTVEIVKGINNIEIILNVK